MRIPRGAFLATLAVCAVVPATASAAVWRMTVTPLTPTAGGSIAATSTPPIFRVQLPDEHGTNQLTASVASQGSTTADGLLDHVIASGSFSYEADNGQIYSGPVPGSFASTPGTYWVQYSYASDAADECVGIPAPCTVASQVIQFTVSAAASPPPTGDQQSTPPPPSDHLKVWPVADAKSTIPGLIVKGAHRPASHLRRDCHRAGLFGFQCRTTWIDAKYRWNGIFRLRIDAATREVRYRYYGKRASRHCLARARFKSNCRHDWAF